MCQLTLILFWIHNQLKCLFFFKLRSEASMTRKFSFVFNFGYHIHLWDLDAKSDWLNLMKLGLYDWYSLPCEGEKSMLPYYLQPHFCERRKSV